MLGQLRTVKANARPAILLDSTRTLLSMLRLDRDYFKVFCIGFNKTGTSSINQTLNVAGVSAIHSSNWCAASPRLVQFLFRGFSDGSPVHFRHLDRRFPNSRFILNVRDLHSWLDSRREHAEHDRGRGRHLDIPSWDVNDAAIEYWIRERNEHHIAVLEHFAREPDRLLVVNYVRDPDAADKIARFVGSTRIPERAHVLPVRELSKRTAFKHKAQIESVLGRLSIPESEWRSDIYCRSLASQEQRSRWPSDTSERHAVTAAAP